MNILNFLKSFFSKAIVVFKRFILEAIPVARQIVVGQLSQFAKQVTLELDQTDLNNDDKRKAAFKRIGEYAKSNGIQAKDSLINAVIELAVLSWKREF